MKWLSKSGSSLTDEQIILAERWKARQAAIEESRKSPKIDPSMRARVSQLFRKLSASLESNARSFHRPSRGGYEMPLEAPRKPTEADLGARYRADPVRLSAALTRRILGERDEG